MRRRWAVAALIAVAGALAVPGSAAALPDFHWTGATQLAAANSTAWSTDTNWFEASAPSGSVGTLTFPALTSGGCANPPADACYSSINNISGISANAITIDDGVPYSMSGDGITLGAGGLTAAPSANDSGQGGPGLSIPITLGASQTWSITGGSKNQQLFLGGAVTGSAFTLGVNFSGSPFLGLAADDEVGVVTVSGAGKIVLGNPIAAGSLNATDGNPVSFSNGAGLIVSGSNSTMIGPSHTGALSMTGGSLQVGQGLASTSNDGTLAVAGGLTLSSSAQTTASFYIDQNGTTPGADFSQLTSTGTVALGTDAMLAISGSSAHSLNCPTLNQGQVYPIISAASVTGTFSNAPDGTVLKMSCFGGTAPSLRINYTSTSVTATVVPGGSGGGGGPTTTALLVSTRTPAPGRPEGLTAVVTPQQGGSGAPTGRVEFFDNGQPIPTCSNQPLVVGSTSSRASCVIRYSATGSHTLTAHYLGDGNFASSTSAPRTINVIAAPNTTILGVRTNSAARNADVAFKGSGGVGTLNFQCRLDSGTWTTCSSPKAYNSLAKGQHTVAVRAIDSRRVSDPTPDTRSFSI